MQGAGCRVQGVESRLWGLQFGVHRVGLRDWGCVGPSNKKNSPNGCTLQETGLPATLNFRVSSRKLSVSDRVLLAGLFQILPDFRDFGCRDHRCVIWVHMRDKHLWKVVNE